MLRVYIAGPIGKNDEHRPRKLARAVAAGFELLDLGFAPFVPHLWAAASLQADGRRSYEEWMAYDLAFLTTCAAVLRLDGESPGADREVARAEELHIPVFYRVGDLVAWGDLR